MKTPQNIIEIFESESKNIKFGKVTLSFVARGVHTHYEIDKHFSILINEDSEENQINGDKND
jgi:hypothetical protein